MKRGTRTGRLGSRPGVACAGWCAGAACAVLATLSLAPAALSAPKPVPPGMTEAAAEQLGTQAYEYGIPLMEFIRQARQQTSVTVPDALLNQLGSARQLDTAANTGPRLEGSMPHGLKRIRSGYQHVWLVGRTLVNGPGDLTAVHRVQNGYRLIPLAGWIKHGLAFRPPRPAKSVAKPTKLKEPGGLAFFDQLGTALAQNPPPKRDQAILSQLRKVGIGPGLRPSREHLTAPVLAPAGQLPPARYFWSLTMYNVNFFLVANPIHRYELGSRARHLKLNPDGCLDVYIQHTAPPGHEANWLPAPRGTFEVTLRMYGPKASALHRQYAYPPIEQTS